MGKTTDIEFLDAFAKWLKNSDDVTENCRGNYILYVCNAFGTTTEHEGKLTISAWLTIQDFCHVNA